MNERKLIDIEPAESSFSACEISKKIIHLLRHSQTYNEKTMEQFNSGESRIFFRINFHKNNCLMSVGKLAWQQEEVQKGDISIVLIFQEQLYISKLFEDIQDAISLILHYRTMWMD